MSQQQELPEIVFRYKNNASIGSELARMETALDIFAFLGSKR